MKVFISSVRRGLETERDALPALCIAVGHDPIRFEDLTAQSAPSREVCLRGVQESDVYVLLLGEHYGTAFPETGRSPTHEEFVAATVKGVPRLVFRRNGVTPDPEQARFIEEIGAYGTGVFWDTFDSAADLLPKVVTALNAAASSPLDWQPLHESPDIQWRSDGRRHQTVADTELEVHVVPVPAAPVSRRRLLSLPDELVGIVRAASVVPAADPVSPGSDDSAAWVTYDPPQTRSWRTVDMGGFAGMRVAATGHVTVWERVPQDSMGAALDVDDLSERLGRSLRLAGTVTAAASARYAVAAGLSNVGRASVTPIGRLGDRTSASFGFQSNDVRIDADESVSAAALAGGSGEVGRLVAQQLIDTFQRRSG